MIWKILSWESVSFGDEKNLKAKWIKADILKTQNELKVLSPSLALLRRRGKEGLAQTAPGLGKSQLQTRFTFLAKLSLAIHKEGAALKKKKKKMRQPSTVEIKREISAASSTSNHSTVCFDPSYFFEYVDQSWIRTRSVGQSGQHRQSVKIILDV